MILGAVEVGIELSIGHELVDEQELIMVVGPLEFPMPQPANGVDLRYFFSSFIPLEILLVTS